MSILVGMDDRRIIETLSWVHAAALHGKTEAEILKGFCERLNAAGVPVWRAMVGTDTLHPVIGGHAAVWTDGAETRVAEYAASTDDKDRDSWLRSPFHALYATRGTLLRRRLTAAEPWGEFPVVDEIREQGATDYVCMLFHLGERTSIGELDCVFSSWSTREAGGFTDDQVAALQETVAGLALALHGRAVTRIAETLVDTYLGRDAGRRVLSGHIRRGVADRTHKVLWFSDLQGFTRITDSAPPELVIPLLNDYADALVTAIHGQDGQVLKFIGDGILAIFGNGDGNVAHACTAALDAAADALVRVRQVNERRTAEGLPVTRFYLGLHEGEVFYGNVGSADRLDFTVIGPAVNEASRIASMCRQLDQDVLLSSAFAAAAPDCRDRLISVGRYLLRGVGRPQELFTLDPDGPPPAAGTQPDGRSGPAP